MTDSFTLIVLLYVDPERQEDYERFEAAASRIMGRYGGCIERRVVVRLGSDPSEGEPERPTEVHIVTFPSEKDFEAYLHDPELDTLGELRTRAIRRTEVWRGRDLSGFAEEN